MIVDPVLLVAAGLLGAILGSFLNVCIVRLPNDESVIHPRSKCPACGLPVAWFDNVPVVSWLVLRGRCRGCDKRISAQYPLVEIAVAAIWGVSFWFYGATLIALTAAVFATILLGIAVTDGKTYIIPDEFSLGGFAIGLSLALAAGLPRFADALIGAAAGFGLLYAVAWLGEKALGKQAMGGGDVKMMAMIGAFIGWKGVLMTLFLGSLLGTLVFLPLRLFGKNPLVPFGVFLAAAAGVTFVVGDGLLGWYLGFVQQG